MVVELIVGTEDPPRAKYYPHTHLHTHRQKDYGKSTGELSACTYPSSCPGLIVLCMYVVADSLNDFSKKN